MLRVQIHVECRGILLPYFAYRSRQWLFLMRRLLSVLLLSLMMGASIDNDTWSISFFHRFFSVWDIVLPSSLSSDLFWFDLFVYVDNFVVSVGLIVAFGFQRILFLQFFAIVLFLTKLDWFHLAVILLQVIGWKSSSSNVYNICKFRLSLAIKG